MLVALLTDFGTKDGFVGVMKGVMLSINPSIRTVDISHEVEPFNVLEGALILKAHFSYFPPKTVFVAVVDPGVGSERPAIAMRLGQYFFVGPHNGIFDLVVKEFQGPPSAVILDRERYHLPRKNNTFHGRDVFSPVAAYITKGIPLEELGTKTDYRPVLDIPSPRDEGKRLTGEIIYFDRFGNGITNVPCGDYTHGKFRGETLRVVPFFQAGERGKLNLTCGSFGFMEVFVPMDSAMKRFHLKLGEKVELWRCTR